MFTVLVSQNLICSQHENNFYFQLFFLMQSRKFIIHFDAAFKIMSSLIEWKGSADNYEEWSFTARWERKGRQKDYSNQCLCRFLYAAILSNRFAFQFSIEMNGSNYSSSELWSFRLSKDFIPINITIFIMNATFFYRYNR